MRKTFVSNLILLIALNLLVKPFYILVVEAEIQNRVGAETFGNYFSLINFSFLFNILLDLGTTNWNTRQLSQNSAVIGKYFSGIATLRILLTLAYMLLAAVGGFMLGYSWEQFEILLFLAFNQVLASMILYLRSNLSGLHLFRQDSVVSVLDRVVLVILMSLLLWGNFTGTGSFKIEWLVWGQTIAYGIALVVALVLVTAKAGKIKWEFDRALSLSVLKQSMPFALLILFSMITYRVDGVMLERLLDDNARQAGIYAMGFRFYEAFNMIAYLFAVLLLPIFSRMLQQKQDVGQLTALAFKLMFVGSWSFSVFCWFYGHDVLSAFYDHNVEQANISFAFLIAGCFSFSLQYVFGTLLTANGNFKALVTVSLIAMVLNISLNFYLIPGHGAAGAAITNFISQSITLVLQILLVWKYFKFSINSRLMAGTFLFGGGVLAYTWFTSAMSWTFGFSILVFTGAVLLLAIFTRMLDVKRFVEMVRNSG